MAHRSIRREMHDKKVDLTKPHTAIGQSGQLRILSKTVSDAAEKVSLKKEEKKEPELVLEPESIEEKNEAPEEVIEEVELSLEDDELEEDEDSEPESEDDSQKTVSKSKKKNAKRGRRKKAEKDQS